MSLTRRLLVLAFGLVTLGMAMPTGFAKVSLLQIFVLPLAFVVFYVFVNWVFVSFKKKLKDNEGFFFMGILILKFLALLAVAIVWGKENIAQNHSLVLLFVVCYFAFLALYAYHMVHLLGERDK